MASEVVVVAGMNYPVFEKITGGGFALQPLSASQWRTVALHWAHRELRTKGTVVTLFDTARGTVERLDRSGRAPVTVQQHRAPRPEEWRLLRADPTGTIFLHRVPPVAGPGERPRPRFAHDVHLIPGEPISLPLWRFRRHGVPALGMQQVYNHLCDAGRDRPGSIRGLHVFSHAFQGGPILTNSLDWVGPKEPARDVDDTDGRKDKDFSGANLPRLSTVAPGDLVTALRTREWFEAAWADDALAVLWGCEHDDFVAQLIKFAVHHVGTGSGAGRVVPYRFGSEAAWGNTGFERWLHLLRADPQRPWHKLSIVPVPLPVVRDIVLELLHDSWAAALRRTLDVTRPRPGIRVYAAPLGTSTVIEQPTGPDLAMRVAGDEDILGFYRDVVGVAFGDELGGPGKFGRGYVRID